MLVTENLHTETSFLLEVLLQHSIQAVTHCKADLSMNQNCCLRSFHVLWKITEGGRKQLVIQLIVHMTDFNFNTEVKTSLCIFQICKMEKWTFGFPWM